MASREKAVQGAFYDNLFLQSRIVYMRGITKRSVVAAIIAETCTLACFLLFAGTADADYYNWFALAHLVSWISAIVLTSTTSDPLTAALNLMYVAFAVVTFDLIGIGFRSADIHDGFNNDDKLGRKVALLVINLGLLMITGVHIWLGVLVRSSYPRLTGEVAEKGAPNDITIAEINEAYRKFDEDKFVEWAVFGEIVRNSRLRLANEDDDGSADDGGLGKLLYMTQDPRAGNGGGGGDGGVPGGYAVVPAGASGAYTLYPTPAIRAQPTNGYAPQGGRLPTITMVHDKFR